MKSPHDFVRDRGGTVTVIFAASLVVIFACAALALDLVTIWTAKRKLQSAVDLAAILAAANVSSATDVARRSVSDNGFSADAPSAVVSIGAYAGISGSDIRGRFVADINPANAARVTLATSVYPTFSRVIGLPASYRISATGTAATAQLASFTLGSRLLSLDGGIANAILGALLGQTITLTAMDYNALANARIDGTSLLNALALRANISAATYEDVLAASVTLGQALSAIRETVSGGTAADIIERLLSGLNASAATGRVPVSSLIDFGDVPLPARIKTSGGQTLPALPAIMNAVAISNGARQVSVDLGGSIPGILRTRITVSVGERKQRSGLVNVGSSKATLRTAQTRILIEATTSLGALTPTLPVYVQSASAVATLTSVSCPWTSAGRRSVNVEARPGVVQLAVADVSSASLDPTRPSPSFANGARILATPLVTVTGYAQMTWDAPYARTLTFTEEDISNGAAKQVASSKPSGSLTGSLLSTLRLDVSGLSAGPLLQGLRPALEALAEPIDKVLDSTLAILGIQLGVAEVVVEGTRCDQAVLVQ